jgi:hypothetical protein
MAFRLRGSFAKRAEDTPERKTVQVLVVDVPGPQNRLTDSESEMPLSDTCKMLGPKTLLSTQLVLMGRCHCTVDWSRKHPPTKSARYTALGLPENACRSLSESHLDQVSPMRCNRESKGISLITAFSQPARCGRSKATNSERTFRQKNAVIHLCRQDTVGIR